MKAFSFQFFIRRRIGKVKFGKHISCPCFHFCIGFAEYFYQFIAFSLKKTCTTIELGFSLLRLVR